ncbi:hypothetical protein PL9214670054 [Planktothrix tepida PCC 9214]|uniref:Uncharacterized protein n=1 Tax=Planktothrix tepida PCC 9214 TaxID=671072 RepID=A0A1J1LUB0_9CYAN|nr:hypothetical protein PL9214670054 [Planktothrix tepida PCC 9214]
MNQFQIVQVIGQIVSEAEEITGDFINGVGDFISSSEEQELRNLYL